MLRYLSGTFPALGRCRPPTRNPKVPEVEEILKKNPVVWRSGSANVFATVTAKDRPLGQ